MSDLVPKENRRTPRSFDDIEVDLSLLVFRGLLPTMVVAIVSATGLTMTLAIRYHDRFLVIQTIITFLLCTIRMMVVYRFTRVDHSKLTLATARRWQTVYGVVTFVHCLTMAVTTFHAFRVLPREGGWLCTMGIYCVCLGLGSRTGMRPWIIQLSGAALLTTLAVSIALSAQNMRWVAVTIVMFFVYQFSHALQIQFEGAVEQLRIRRKLRVLSEQDTLTGLANRRHFENSLARLCALHSPFAILFIDLDRFKHVNDVYGHSAGDALLIQVGERLASILRPSDLLARLGGDEFAILQSPVSNAECAQALALRVNQEIALPFHIENHEVRTAASVGIRLSDPSHTDADVLVGMADRALYAVKQAGGGSFSLAGV